MSNKIEFSKCPCCGAEKYGLIQDKVHLDWARRCVACGYEIELAPRARSRNFSVGIQTVNDDSEFDIMCSDLRLADNIEDLFTVFEEQ